MKTNIFYSLIFITGLFIFQSCVLPTKLTERGNYDQAIEKMLKNLRVQKKWKEKDIDLLKEAFAAAKARAICKPWKNTDIFKL